MMTLSGTGKTADIVVLSRAHPSQPKGIPLGARLQDHLPSFPRFLLRSYQRFSVKPSKMYSSFLSLFLFQLIIIITRYFPLSTTFSKKQKFFLQNRDKMQFILHFLLPFPRKCHRFPVQRFLLPSNRSIQRVHRYK